MHMLLPAKKEEEADDNAIDLEFDLKTTYERLLRW
jgi:hypothetical protein